MLLIAGWWLQAHAGPRGIGPQRTEQGGGLQGRVVAIDPGHGGIDPGAIGPYGVNEDTINLAVSLRLARLLEGAGAIVVLTRTGDTDRAGATEGGPAARKRVDLRARVALINAAGPAVVLSVHTNHFRSPSAHGAQVFYSVKGARPSAAERVKRAESLALARILQDQLARQTGETRRAVSEHIDHFLLTHTLAPGVTIELGFLSNPREARLLADPAYQQRLAQAIFSGLTLWFARAASAAGSGA